MASTQLETVLTNPAAELAADEIGQSRELFETLAGALERTADFAAVAVAIWLADAVYEFSGIGRQLHYSAREVLSVAFTFAAVFVFMLARDGGYERGNSLMLVRETERVLRVSVQMFGLLFFVVFSAGHLFSRATLLFAVVLVPVLIIIEKQLMFLATRHLHSLGYGRQNVLLYGAGFTGRRVFSSLARSPKLGLNPVAVVDDDPELVGSRLYESGYHREFFVEVIAGPITRDLIRDYCARYVIVGIPSLPAESLNNLSAEAAAARARVAFVPQLSYDSAALTDYIDIDGVLIAALGGTPGKQWYERVKRAFDVVVALALTLLTSPLWALIACMIRRDSPGPVFFQQLRVGRGGRLFNLYKFRSMSVTAPKYDYHPKGNDDLRMTRIGRWLRKTSLDELPQLINILKGDMSLVGPRPEMPFIVEQYNRQQRQRLRVTPGLTGLWQLSADRAFLIHENLQYDLYYIRNRSFFMDLAILLHTFFFAMRGV